MMLYLVRVSTKMLKKYIVSLLKKIGDLLVNFTPNEARHMTNFVALANH